MNVKRLFSVMLAVFLVIASTSLPASASDSAPESKVTGATAPTNILQYLEYCEVEINDDSVIQATESMSRSSDNGAALHITTKKGDSIEDTFLTYYDTDGSTLDKGDLAVMFDPKTRASTAHDFYAAGVTVKMTAVYTRTTQNKNYVTLTGHYFTIYKNTASPTLTSINTDAFVVGDLYNISSGNYSFVKSNAVYTSYCNKQSPAYNTMYSGNSSMPSNQAIVPVNVLGGLGVEFTLKISGSDRTYGDVYNIASGWF